MSVRRRIGAPQQTGTGSCELAHGTYFKWLAADDLVEPTYIERCVAVLDEEPDVVLVTPRVRLIDATGKPLQRTPGTDRYVAPHGETKGAPRAPVTGLASRSALRRFRSVVMFVTDSGLAAYDMSLIRLEPLRSTMLVEPYVGSEKILLAQLSLDGAIRPCARGALLVADPCRPHGVEEPG